MVVVIWLSPLIGCDPLQLCLKDKVIMFLYILPKVVRAERRCYMGVVLVRNYYDFIKDP